MRKIFPALMLLAAATPAFAVDPITVPEPGSLALLAIAVVGAVVARSRGKKK